MDEARLLCDVRQRVANAVNLDIFYTHPADLIGRYEQLMAANRDKTRPQQNIQASFVLEAA